MQSRLPLPEATNILMEKKPFGHVCIYPEHYVLGHIFGIVPCREGVTGGATREIIGHQSTPYEFALTILKSTERDTSSHHVISHHTAMHLTAPYRYPTRPWHTRTQHNKTQHNITLHRMAPPKIFPADRAPLQPNFIGIPLPAAFNYYIIPGTYYS